MLRILQKDLTEGILQNLSLFVLVALEGTIVQTKELGTVVDILHDSMDYMNQY